MNWIKELVELQDASNGDAVDFVDSVKQDIFSERIYVFTPTGAVQELPKIQVRLTLPMLSIRRLGKKQLVLRLTDVWCH